MAFNLATTPALETARRVAAYLDEATGCSRALALQNQDPALHERLVSLTLFHARSVPTIDLDTYITRILKYCPCENEVFLALILYMQQMIDRCARRRIPFTVDAYSIHRLVITGVAIGSKCFSDVFFTNSRYSKVRPTRVTHPARVGGLSLEELNTLELQFLTIIDFDLNIPCDVLQAIGANLFAGRLPLLTNIHADAAHYHHPQQAPASARHAHHPYAHPGYADPTQQQQQLRHPVPPPGDAFARQHRAQRRMSYPGPSGVCYPNSYYPYAQPVRDLPARPAYKRGHPANGPAAHANPDLSSGSTLASSPPNDSLQAAALHQGRL
ncbi:cyclin-like protein interacting with PHO85 [Coemansia javaensis]|uniref:Cyclin-like protein interacting with PHO85 n=1 Tax=Coemansia javaensis TaxID=2761396 RepID=A0A9W8LGG0_9FUNG|nr:cyclin-like protein interacting with PHO85 [Coemansia javaensis]